MYHFPWYYEMLRIYDQNNFEVYKKDSKSHRLNKNVIFVGAKVEFLVESFDENMNIKFS